MSAPTSVRSGTRRPGPAAKPSDAPRRRRRGPRRGPAAGTWYFLLPALVLYAFAVLIPSAQGIVFAFTDWNGLDLSWNFVGLDNFTRVLEDDQALRAIRNTLALAVVITIVENVIGLLLALGVHNKIRSRHVLRLIFFAPVVVVSVVIAFLWQFIYTPGGPLTQVFESVGLGSLAQNWLGDPSVALWAIAVVVIWQFAGYSMVIFLAGLQSVPKDVLEAGAIDGAGPVRRFWSIVLPLLGPAITVNVMLSMIRGLMIFDQIWVMTQGGPAQSTDSLSTLVYRNAFQYSEFGYSTALAVVLALFVAVISILQYRLLSRREKK